MVSVAKLDTDKLVAVLLWAACIALISYCLASGCAAVVGPDGSVGVVSPYAAEITASSSEDADGGATPSAGVFVNGPVLVLWGPALRARVYSLAPELFPLPEGLELDESLSGRILCIRFVPSMEVIWIDALDPLSSAPTWARQAPPFR